MKKLFILATFAATLSAQATPVCPSIEFAELQTYSQAELMDLMRSNFMKSMSIVSMNAASMIEHQNCDVQYKRMMRLYESRLPPKPATPASAAQ